MAEAVIVKLRRANMQNVPHCQGDTFIKLHGVATIAKTIVKATLANNERVQRR